MAKKKGLFGVNTYIKRTRKKRPGRHSKRLNKNKTVEKNTEVKVDERPIISFRQNKIKYAYR